MLKELNWSRKLENSFEKSTYKAKPVVGLKKEVRNIKKFLRQNTGMRCTPALEFPLTQLATMKTVL